MKHLDRISGNVEPIFMPIGADTILVANGSQSAVLSSTDKITVLISSENDTRIKIGLSPIAGASDFFLPAGAVIPIRIKENFKISTFGSDITIMQ
jgi:hypothetical protein